MLASRFLTSVWITPQAWMYSKPFSVCLAECRIDRNQENLATSENARHLRKVSYPLRNSLQLAQPKNFFHMLNPFGTWNWGPWSWSTSSQMEGLRWLEDLEKTKNKGADIGSCGISTPRPNCWEELWIVAVVLLFKEFWSLSSFNLGFQGCELNMYNIQHLCIRIKRCWGADHWIA